MNIPSQKQNKNNSPGGIYRVVERLSSKLEVLGSTPIWQKRKRKKHF
jgi:hypothetical protein